MLDPDNHLILCLDLSKTMSGMAVYADRKLVTLGQRSFSRVKTYGELVLAVENWLDEEAKPYDHIGWDGFFVEHNFAMRGKAQEVQTTMLAGVRRWAVPREAQVMGMSNATMASVAGVKQGDKDGMIAYVQAELGIGLDRFTKKDDVADAIMVGQAVYSKLGTSYDFKDIS